MSLKVRKYILIFLIVLTYLIVFLNFVPINTTTDPVGFVGKAIGVTGILILTWQFLLGVRGLVSRLIPDLIWVNKLHKILGEYGVTLIFFHPILIFFYYTSLGQSLLSFDLSDPFNVYKLFGELAIGILGVVWLLSAFFRYKIGFRWWKKIHLMVYLVLPFALYHSYNIGSDMYSPFFSTTWKALALAYVLILTYKILFNFGFLKLKYEVVDVKEVVKDVHTITLKPLGKFIKPRPGQFIYFQPGVLAENHPFTASHYNEETNYISVTPKASGPFSNQIQNIQVGTKVFVDGPYGVFTQEAYTTTKPIVLIIGGIGITPFLRMIEKIRNGWDKNVILMYANKTIDEAAFVNEFEAVASSHTNFKLINVISEDPNFVGEKGRIDVNLIKKYLTDGLSNYEFFLCGPKPMMKSINKQLIDSGVLKNNIHSEKFSL